MRLGTTPCPFFPAPVAGENCFSQRLLPYFGSLRHRLSMGAKDTAPAARRLPFSSSAFACFVPLLCFAVLFLFSAFRPSADLAAASLPSHSQLSTPSSTHRGGLCDYSDGAWVRDRISVTSAPRYDHTCKGIFKGWNCIANGKKNGRDLLQWRWQPSRCNLPPLDPLRFLQRYRNTNIGFVGDSLNRNMFGSLVCMLKGASSQVRKCRPAGADRGYLFLEYNLTVAYHRTNLLVRYGRWSASSNGGVLESLGYKQGYRVDVDVPEATWAKAPSFHNILIFNTGTWWWAPSKFHPIKSPMLFFEKGKPVFPPVPSDFGLDMALKHMIQYVEDKASKSAKKIFRTQSPRHFEGGDWDQGGSCPRVEPLSPKQVEELFSLENNGTNVEARVVNEHLLEALESSSFRILDVTHISEFRADAHPSSTGGKKHDDCMHWCLPGLTDTWNDLLAAHLEGM